MLRQLGPVFAIGADELVAELRDVGHPLKEPGDLVGFGSYQGSVIAGQEWGAPMARMRVPEGMPGSWENVLHRVARDDRLLLMGPLQQDEAANQWRGHRAIGVVYHPEYEYGNYVPSVLPRRYDAFLFIDQTRALHPLHVAATEAGPPETYPWGL